MLQSEQGLSEALPQTFDSSFIFAIPGLGSRHSLPG